MIAFKQAHRKSHRWQPGFMKMLPQIERLLQVAFQHLESGEREEAIQNAIVLCMLSYASLHKRGRAARVNASNLAWYATLQTKAGRIAGGQLNKREPLSRYAQGRSRIKRIRLHSFDKRAGEWIDTIVEDRRAPIPDVVAARLDVRAWLRTLCQRTRRIACDLAKGYSTAEAAGKYKVTPGRISQIRRELELSWSKFQNLPVLNCAG